VNSSLITALTYTDTAVLAGQTYFYVATSVDASGNESAPNHANYDESKANPYPDLPDPLTLNNGQKVTTAKMWWDQRRPEIVEDFDREVLGRVPRNVPKVTWTVTKSVNGMVGPQAAIGKQLVGHLDNSAYPEITVDIQMTLVVPAGAKGPVPVMMMFGGGAMPVDPNAPAPAPTGRGGFGGAAPAAGSDPPATQQLLADGWGYASINRGRSKNYIIARANRTT
jgi:hypothetical protein